jgi:hypothetical protein
VAPGTARVWRIDLGLAKHFLHDQPLYLRVKFNTANNSPSGTFVALWQVGDPETPKVQRLEPMSLAPDTFHELEIPPNLIDDKGILTIIFFNQNQAALLFPLDEGMEVLYRESGFGGELRARVGNHFLLDGPVGGPSVWHRRAFFPSPWPRFFSLSLLTMALSSGTLTNVVAEGDVDGFQRGVRHDAFAGGHRRRPGFPPPRSR